MATAAAVQRPETDLEWRLAEAQAAEQPKLERVSQLERDLENALARSDYKVAARVKNDLTSARTEHLIASANTQALQGALAAFEQQRRADTEAIERQRRADQARVIAAEAGRAEEVAITELQQLVASVHAGVEAVKADIAEALAMEARATQHRQDRHAALMELGEDAPRPILGPNLMSVTLERDEVLRAVWTGQA